MKIFLLSFLIMGMSFARSNDLAHRPKSFTAATGKAVFVDYSEITYHITYNEIKKESSVKAEMSFYAPEAGHPIFDSVAEPSSISLNGKEATATLTKTPSSETTLRVLNAPVSVGNHRLTVTVPLTTLVEYTPSGVKSAFWMSDLTERKFLEHYLPANLEYDQVKMTFMVNFISSRKSNQVIYTNGIVSKKSGSSFSITYPHYYTASSLYFHTVPAGSTNELRFTIKSIDGRDLPAVVYQPRGTVKLTPLSVIKQKTIEIMSELEGDYGPFPHPSLIVYNAGLGGMEYCGATITEMRALGHELFHSYFARGVMPANGNSGWLDEALASWRDKGYKAETTMAGTSKMSAHPYYTRTTDRAAYSFGARFMSYLDGKLAHKGGIKPFLRYMVERRALAPLFVEEFIQEMSKFYGVSLAADFKQYTYGSQLINKSGDDQETHEHPIHRKMSIEELQKIL